ncbi:MAG: recombination regulator RecX [Burkholderiales bacterium]|nr:recombination regulator RecX [Burkholderiales bacterium]
MKTGHPSLKARALRHLAQREHTRAELARKLARHTEGTPDAPDASDARQLEELLDALAAAGLLSDRRAAEALVGAKAQRLGALRLRQLLRERGVPEDEAAAALQAVRGDELARAQALWQRRFGSVAEDAAGRARQARFLAGRGFDAEVVRRVVRGRGGED